METKSCSPRSRSNADSPLQGYFVQLSTNPFLWSSPPSVLSSSSEGHPNSSTLAHIFSPLLAPWLSLIVLCPVLIWSCFHTSVIAVVLLSMKEVPFFGGGGGGRGTGRTPTFFEKWQVLFQMPHLTLLVELLIVKVNLVYQRFAVQVQRVFDLFSTFLGYFFPVLPELGKCSSKLNDCPTICKAKLGITDSLIHKQSEMPLEIWVT